MAVAAVERTVKIENTIPILRVIDLDASLDYYVNVLGFKQDWCFEGMAGVSRDSSSLYLCQGEQGNVGGWVWVGCEDARLIYEEFTTSGAKIREVPTNYPWALETKIEDPDGNVLRFGSTPLAEAG